MYERTLRIAVSGRQDTKDARDARLPIWACAAIILGVSAGVYWLLFRALGALFGW
jgi:hypothetical protein